MYLSNKNEINFLIYVVYVNLQLIYIDNLVLTRTQIF